MKITFFLSMLLVLFHCSGVAGQTLLDQVFDANSMDSLKYDYVMGIRSGNNVVKQLHGTLLTTPKYYCDSNDQKIAVRSGTVYFEADMKKQSVYLGYVKPDSANRDAKWMQKLRSKLLGISGSYLKVDSSDNKVYKITAHFSIGEIVDFSLEAEKNTLKIKSFNVTQRVRVEEKNYLYELTAYNVETNISTGSFDDSRFFLIDNKRIRPSGAWRTYKVEYL